MITAWIPIWIIGGPLLGMGLLSLIVSEITSPSTLWIAIPNAR